MSYDPNPTPADFVSFFVMLITIVATCVIVSLKGAGVVTFSWWWCAAPVGVLAIVIIAFRIFSLFAR